VKHEWAHERYAEYLMGELRGRELRSFEEHLEQCVTCRRELEQLARLHERLTSEMPVYRRRILPDPSILSGLARKALSRATAPRRHQWLLPFAAAAVVVVLGVILVFGTPLRDSLLGRDSEPPAPTLGPGVPFLQVSEPVNGQVLTRTPTQVSGKVEQGATVTVNGVEAKVSEDGSFVASVPLETGTNVIEIHAEAPDGRAEKVTVIVTFSAP